MQGRVLGGRYHLDEVLGVGGMSTVWRAHDVVLGRDVAVKVLSGRHAGDAGSRRQIRVEARAAAGLAHPNVAQVHDFGETVEDGQRTPYIVMELVPGPTLHQRFGGAPLPPPLVFRICAEVAAGLAAAHADGLVHRDVKPANVILAPTGAKVVDFGIAAGFGAVEDDDLLGTPEYLAPERMTEDAVTPASDVYSLGVLLYRLLAGHLPWTASGSAGLLEAHLLTPPAALPALPGVPSALAQLCERCLAKDPADRPTAAEVAAILAAAAVSTPAGAFGAAFPDAAGDEPAIAASVRAPAATGGATAVVPDGSAAAAQSGATAGAAGGATAGAAGGGVAGGSGGGGWRRTRLAAGLAGATAAGLLVWLVLPAPDPISSAPAQADPGVQNPTTPAGLTPAGLPSAGTVSPTPGASGNPGTSGTSAASGPSARPGGGAGPGGPTSPGSATPASVTPTTSAAAPPGPGAAETFASEGGTVRARCASPGVAELLSWAPAAPYRTDWVSAGPAAAATVTFVHGNRTVGMTVTCGGLDPSSGTTTTGG
ncbi:serine/threonine-protein kinase [Dactylosporangium maewongense]|uniref:serine/threonine-protein kinase n=1 Tax=Dactylosporangium maewongense TaxID=634393 RepID=UPI0031D6AD4E